MENILIVDDDVEIANVLEIYLKNEGYLVSKAYNAVEALDIMKKTTFSLVILDIMMPGIDGYQLCCKIRETSNMPILMLSAKDTDMDKIMGLTTGADDYMTKPFNPLELTARVKSQLRRYLYLNANNDIVKDKNTIKIGVLTIDTLKCTIDLLGVRVNLTPKEYGILVLLAKNEGIVFSSEDIFKEVWGEEYYCSNNTVMVHIWNLREKLEDNPKNPKLIKTVWGMGYKIEI